MTDTVMRIALVEDARGDVRWLRLMLDEAGIDYQLTVFDAGIKALESFRSSPPPHLIISDWLLPVLEFSDFVRSTRAIPTYELVPIVVLTGVADPIREEALALGAICCLEKPVEAKQLRDLLARLTKSSSIGAR